MNFTKYRSILWLMLPSSVVGWWKKKQMWNFENLKDPMESRKFAVRFWLQWRPPEGIHFHWRGLKKCFLQFKTLRRVIYIPLEGFRYLSRGFIIPLEGFRNLSKGFVIPLERFSYPSYGFIITLERFRYPSLGFVMPLEGFRYLS